MGITRAHVPSLCLALATAAAILGTAYPAAAQDPRKLMPQPAPDFASASLPDPGCAALAATPALDQPLDLPTLVDLALCRNPRTASAWSAVRTAAAQAGQTRSAYGPSVSASLGPNSGVTRISGDGFPSTTDWSVSGGASLSIGWLLFDFGNREARISAADANRAVALASFADQAQGLVLEVGLAYNSLLAALANQEAAKANLGFAKVSLDAATARERAGVGIKSDRLQADAAYAQAILTMRQAEGDVAISRGNLAVAVALPPQTLLRLAAPPPLGSARDLGRSADALIARADTFRPDLKLREASLRVSEANLASAKADRRPSISLGATPTASFRDSGSTSLGATAGVTLSIPIFDSGGRTYAVEAAKSEVERSEALLQSARQSASLDVWTRLQNYETQAANLDTARRLLASADEAARLAQGRYRSGLATVTELLNAQSALVNARQQQVGAEFGVRSAEYQLARSVGSIGEAVE